MDKNLFYVNIFETFYKPLCYLEFGLKTKLLEFEKDGSLKFSKPIKECYISDLFEIIKPSNIDETVGLYINIDMKRKIFSNIDGKNDNIFKYKTKLVSLKEIHDEIKYIHYFRNDVYHYKYLFDDVCYKRGRKIVYLIKENDCLKSDIVKIRQVIMKYIRIISNDKVCELEEINNKFYDLYKRGIELGYVEI